MKLHNENSAPRFDTKDECWQWIDQRVVRFKLKMVKAQTSDGNFTFLPQKCDGKIINTSIDGFKEDGTDEPLRNYAAPAKLDNKWLAVMRLQEG